MFPISVFPIFEISNIVFESELNYRTYFRWEVINKTRCLDTCSKLRNCICCGWKWYCWALYCIARESSLAIMNLAMLQNGGRLFQGNTHSKQHWNIYSLRNFIQCIYSFKIKVYSIKVMYYVSFRFKHCLNYYIIFVMNFIPILRLLNH